MKKNMFKKNIRLKKEKAHKLYLLTLCTKQTRVMIANLNRKDSL